MQPSAVLFPKFTNDQSIENQGYQKIEVEISSAVQFVKWNEEFSIYPNLDIKNTSTVAKENE